MSAHYIHPMLYVCDEPRCKSEAEATNVRLPAGWQEAHSPRSITGPEPIKLIHRCPKCVAPESKERES